MLGNCNFKITALVFVTQKSVFVQCTLIYSTNLIKLIYQTLIIAIVNLYYKFDGYLSKQIHINSINIVINSIKLKFICLHLIETKKELENHEKVQNDRENLLNHIKEEQGEFSPKVLLGASKSQKNGAVPTPLFHKRVLNINGLIWSTKFSKRGMAQRNFVANLKKIGKKLRKYILKGYVFVQRIKKLSNTTTNVF